jgi:aurora kinase
VNIDLKYPRYLSAEIRDFIAKLLIRNPKNRMSLSDALEHPFLKKYAQN